MLSLLTLLLASHTVSVDATIRDRRAIYNHAITARNLTAIDPMLAPDYVVLAGVTGTPLSREALLALFAKDFRDPSFVTYVRTPDQVLADSSGKRVAETGHWRGIWKRADGPMIETGVYQAFWLRQAGGWTLINESFVRLHCAGSRDCEGDD